MRKSICGVVFFILLCITACANDTKNGENIQAVKIVTIEPDRVINRFEEIPIGLNVNYFIDNDKINNPEIPLSEAIKSLGVKYLRYPGGDKSDNNLFSLPPYEKSNPSLSRKGKGTSMGRDAFLVENESSFKHEPLDFDAFMVLCQKTGCEPIIVVPCDSRVNNFPEATFLSSREQLIEHAAEWVRYANVKKNYNIKYWMIGNESWHPTVTYGGGYNAEIYAQDVIDFSKAMKTVDPTISIIPNVSSEEESFVENLLKKASGSFDFICISNYPIKTYKNGYEDWVNKKTSLVFPFTEVLELIEKHATCDRDRNMQLIVAEFGPFDWWDGWGMDGDMGHVMCNFDIIGKLLQQPRLNAACFWNTRWMLEPNPWPGFNALDNNNNFHPMAYSVSFWNKYFYPEIIACNTGMEKMITYATFNKEERSFFLYVLNQDEQEQDFSIKIRDKKIQQITRVAQMLGQSSTDFEPIVHEAEIKENFLLQVPAYSISIYRIEVKS